MPETLHTEITGRGAPLALLHGWAVNRRVFEDLAARLSPRFEVHSVDLPGHGDSAGIVCDPDPGAIAARVFDAVPDGAVWVGWSLGGMIALAGALAAPERIRALVMVASSPRFSRTHGWRHAMEAETIGRFADRLRDDYGAALWDYLALQFPGVGRNDPRVRALHEAQYAAPPARDAITAGERILLDADLREESAGVRVPSLLVTGALDAMVLAKVAADWNAIWPELVTERIAGAAHSPFNTHPEAFIDALDRFLGARSAATATRSPQESPTMASEHGQEPEPDAGQPDAPLSVEERESSATASGHASERGHEPGPHAGQSNVRLSVEEMEGFYRTMARVRRFDQKIAELFEDGEIKGTAHSYVGQEAVAAGVCANLTGRDFIASHHRGHGHCIAKGADMGRMMAELMGRETGYCRGLGGSMHIADLDLRILGANGIVGASMPLACGAALAAKLRGEDSVVVAFFGDGASNQGVFHESLNLAAVWRLPVVFVCENNQYALTTSYRNTTSVERIADRAASYGIPGLRVDGNEVGEVCHVAREAIAGARAGEGPTLIEALTYRWGQHSMRANLKDPRPEDEFSGWMARDPIKRLADGIESVGNGAGDRLGAIDTEVEDELDRAVEFGRGGAAPGVDAMRNAVCAPHANYPPPPPPGTRALGFPQALNEALRQEMARDERVFLMGEDVGETGGIFTVSAGLMQEFGEARVRDTPISEATFVGCGVGAAVAGMRPVVEIQIFDFIALTMDMMANQAAKLRFMLGGRNTVPLVVRGPQGGGVRLAAQHSQSLEAWFTHVPGLVVVAPSSPYDAKGLLVSAIRDDNPVVFCEAKLSYMAGKGPVPEALYALPLGKADVKREGGDVTVVATMAMVPRALAAAETLAREGVSVEVIDPRTLRPLDEDTILSSVRKTSRALVVHEAWTTGGFGAEVSALIADKAFMDLDAPVRRLGALDVPMPYNDALERATIPSVERIGEAIRELAAF